jgi:hypothetical protein
MPLIPVLLVAICALLAWWAGFGRPKKVRAAIWAGFAVLCLSLSHVCIQAAMHGPQARRLDFALSMLPYYLGDYAQMGPQDALAVVDHIKALSDASSQTAAVWAFPLETRRTRRTLARLLERLEIPVNPSDEQAKDE